MSLVLLYCTSRSHEAFKAFILSYLNTFTNWFRGIYLPAASSSSKPLLAAMAPNHQHKASEASFTKLKGMVNYELWTCNMAVALQTVELWSFVTDQRK